MDYHKIMEGVILLDSIDYYNQNARDYYDHTVELDMEKFYEKFISLLPEGGAVLDLGCGSGRDSLHFLEEGFDVTALDGSKELCELAQIHIGQDVLNMKFEEMSFDEVFDGVWACASLLHVDENEIDYVLNKVIEGMTPGGILFLSFKHGDFSGVINQRYFKYYNTRSLKELMERHQELDVIEIIKTTDVREERSNEKWISVLARKIDSKDKAN